MSLTGLEGPLLAGVSLAADCSESQEKRSQFPLRFLSERWQIQAS
jgi:hypothetical protein